MKISLINLPSPALAEPWTNFPLGLGYVAASLKRRGYDIQIIDLSPIENEGKLFSSLIKFDSQVYGLSITTPQLNYAKNLAQTIKLTRNLSYLVQELQTMEMDKMFPTKDNKYHMNK